MGDTKISLIADAHFKDGFIIRGAQHEDGIIGRISLPTSKEEPAWIVSQWFCKHNIFLGDKAVEKDYFSCSTKSQKVEVDNRDGKSSIILSLNASKEYERERKQGEAWPHLLIEQDLANRCPILGEIKSMELYFSAKMIYCRNYMENPDAKLHCAQTTLFFTVEDKKHSDMWWFGIPIFDNREYIRKEYMAIDSGKADCTNKFIYTVAQSEFTEKSFHEFNRVITYKKDIYPYIVKGMIEAKKRGYIQSEDPFDFRLTSFNLGWEITGTYDASIAIENFQVYYYI